MNGMIFSTILACRSLKIPCYTVTASTWKTWAGKTGLKRAKKFKKTKMNHFSDAFDMTRYCVAKLEDK